MKLFRVLNLVVIIALLSLIISPAYNAAASSYEINFNIQLEKEDFPAITINIKNFSVQKAEFEFISNFLWVISDLKSVFKNIEVKNKDGYSISWTWSDRKIIVNNENFKDFTIKYTVDALNVKRDTESGPNAQRFVIFRYKRIFFIAGDILALPTLHPEKITVSFSLPEGVSIFSSLPSENNNFIAVKDLWGTLVYDFQKTYFTGGQPIFTLTHQTEWGDKYLYIWFDRDPTALAWLPSYGNTPWEQAESYMKMTEMFSKYYRENIGALPNRTVLFTNVIPASSGSPPVRTNTNFFHYMQVWPMFSEPEVCHHVFHQYSLFLQNSKLPFVWYKTGKVLMEGLPTYFEQTLPSLLFTDPRYEGKLFEFYVLEKRGQPFLINQNWYHYTYNIPALKVYMLDHFIQQVTSGNSSVIDFVKALWDEVKDRTKPQMVTESEITSAFTKIVGAGNANYLNTMINKTDFNLSEFKDLLPSFDAYANWMSAQYFWNKKLLFLVYLDLTAALGNEWPHFATYPHNIYIYRPKALTKFKEYLITNAKNPITKDDVVKAMNYVSGKDHSGFFEFWESLGYPLDPNKLANFDEWNMDVQQEDNLVPVPWMSVGSLKTQHFLSDITQDATIILDNPDDDGTIFVNVQKRSFNNYIPGDKLKGVLQGSNVSFLYTYTFPYKNLYITGSMFKVTTDDTGKKKFKVRLTFPPPTTYPSFQVSSALNTQPIGSIYYVGPVNPVPIKIQKDGNSIVLQDTELEGEYFIVKSTGVPDIKALSGEKVSVSSGNLEIYLYDKFDFLRGYTATTVDTTPPVIEVNIPMVTYKPVLQITGKVIDDVSGVKDSSILINNAKVTLNNDSTFTYTLNLTEGNNMIVITAEDNAGNKAEKTFVVKYIKRTVLKLQIGNKTMYINDSPVELDVAPVITERRTLLPIRWIAEPLGASVSWNSTEKKVTIMLKNSTIELWIGKYLAKVNGVEKQIDPDNSKVVPIIINGRTMLPVRFVSESLGCQVDWDGTTQTVTVIYSAP